MARPPEAVAAADSANLACTSAFSSVCVFCGSKTGNRSSFVEAAELLGEELVRRGVGLVYGGGGVGLMGKVSGTVFRKGGKVLGVIPVALQPVELSGESVGEVRVVADMHERKALMAKEADAFIALPGGFGTRGTLGGDHLAATWVPYQTDRLPQHRRLFRPPSCFH